MNDEQVETRVRRRRRRIVVVTASTTVAGAVAAAAIVASLGGAQRDASEILDPANPPSSTSSPSESPLPGATHEVGLSETLTTIGTGTVTVDWEHARKPRRPSQPSSAA